MQRTETQLPQVQSFDIGLEVVGENVRCIAREQPRSEEASPAPPESVWSQRYNEAASRYAGLNFCSPEAIAAVIAGLDAWGQLLPQRSFKTDGTPEPANRWGLGAERCVLRALQSHLVAVSQSLLAARIHSEIADLIQTAKSLDKCCFQCPPDPHAEKRLVATARIQTMALVQLLSTIQTECARTPAHVAAAPRRKRGHPPKQSAGGDRLLMKAWAKAKGKVGMSRKEFCAANGIAIKTFICAQDRCRKQEATTSQGP